jgi:DNA-binding NarL/FixJ family response regulator
MADLGVLLPRRLDDADALSAAVERVAGGGVVVEPSLGVPRQRTPSPLALLTPRERDVLDLMARGLSNRGIAEQLMLTTNTVGTHVKHVFDKLGMPDSRAGNRRVLAVLTYLNG